MESTQNTLNTEHNETVVEEEENRFQLLDRLFMFLDTDEELNPVLSGYFCKLVSLLISRKQKQLIPYIFDPNSNIIDNLVKHVGQKSISEILNKLITQVDGELMHEQIQVKQQMVVEKLVEHLGPTVHEENNLNSSSIIQDMFETKDFFNILVKKDNIQRIADFATASMTESTKASKTCSLTVLNQIIMHLIEKIKKKGQNTDDKSNNNDDDDMIVQQNSDDEKYEDFETSNPTSLAALTNSLVETILEKIPALEIILQADHMIS